MTFSLFLFGMGVIATFSALRDLVKSWRKKKAISYVNLIYVVTSLSFLLIAFLIIYDDGILYEIKMYAACVIGYFFMALLGLLVFSVVSFIQRFKKGRDIQAHHMQRILRCVLVIMLVNLVFAASDALFNELNGSRIDWVLLESMSLVLAYICLNKAIDQQLELLVIPPDQDTA